MQNRQNLLEEIKKNYRENSLIKPGSGWPPDVQRALNCINSELFEYGFCVQDMRERCHIYQNNFPARFRYFTGVTPSQYIKRHRVACAQKILIAKKTANSIYGVALEVGYEYPSTFSGAFKNVTGMTPAGFWKSRKKK